MTCCNQAFPLELLLIIVNLFVKVRVWVCHLHRLGWSLPGFSGRRDARCFVPRRKGGHAKVSHLQAT